MCYPVFAVRGFVFLKDAVVHSETTADAEFGESRTGVSTARWRVSLQVKVMQQRLQRLQADARVSSLLQSR